MCVYVVPMSNLPSVSRRSEEDDPTTSMHGTASYSYVPLQSETFKQEKRATYETNSYPNSGMDDFNRVIHFPKKLLFFGGFQISSGKTSAAQNRGSVACFLANFYLIMSGLFHIANLIRTVVFCTVYITSSSAIVQTTTIEALLLMIYGTAIYYSSLYSFYKCYPGFLAAIEQHTRLFGMFNVAFLQRHLHKKSRFIFVLNILYALIWTTFGMFNNLRFIMFPLHAVHEGLRGLAYMYSVLVVTLLGLPIFGCFQFYTILIYILSHEFQLSSEKLGQALRDNDSNTEQRLDHFRIVTALSQLTGGYVVLTLVFNMLITCLSIYGISGRQLTSQMILSQLFNIVVSLTFIVAISLRWSTVHSSAHFIGSVINTANWTKLPKTVLHKLNLVLAHCSNTKLGIDVFGLFVLDNGTLMMISGTILTYSVVVIQFQVDKESKNDCALSTNHT